MTTSETQYPVPKEPYRTLEELIEKARHLEHRKAYYQMILDDAEFARSLVDLEEEIRLATERLDQLKRRREWAPTTLDEIAFEMESNNNHIAFVRRLIRQQNADPKAPSTSKPKDISKTLRETAERLAKRLGLEFNVVLKELQESTKGQ